MFGLMVGLWLTVLCVVWALTGSYWLQALALNGCIPAYRLLTRRAAKTRPFPPYPDPPPPQRPTIVKLGVGGAAVAVMAGITVGLGYGLADLGLYPGVWAVFFLGFALPFLALANHFGTQPKPRPAAIPAKGTVGGSRY